MDYPELFPVEQKEEQHLQSLTCQHIRQKHFQHEMFLLNKWVPVKVQVLCLDCQKEYVQYLVQNVPTTHVRTRSACIRNDVVTGN